jgi:hypothetical protein
MEERKLRTTILFSLLASVLVGVVITVISGFVQTPMAHLGVDVVYWGIPLSWSMRVIPTRFQSIDWLNLAADLIFWIAMTSGVSLSVLYQAKKGKITHPITQSTTD